MGSCVAIPPAKWLDLFLRSTGSCEVLNEFGDIEGTKTRSSWNKERRDTSRRLKSLVVKRPSSRGEMKEGQRRMQVARKDMMSRPEYLDRVSQTAEQKRVQTSFVSPFRGPSSVSLDGVSLDFVSGI